MMECRHELHSLVDLLRLESKSEGQLARLKCLKSYCRIDVFFKNCLGIFRRDLFNLHASCSGRHKDRSCRGAVKHNPKIEFAFNGESFLDQESLDFLSFGSCLVGHQLHSEDLSCQLRSLFYALGYFDTAALATA